jgi:hypothetical protein
MLRELLVKRENEVDDVVDVDDARLLAAAAAALRTQPPTIFTHSFV